MPLHCRLSMLPIAIPHYAQIPRIASKDSQNKHTKKIPCSTAYNIFLYRSKIPLHQSEHHIVPTTNSYGHNTPYVHYPRSLTFRLRPCRAEPDEMQTESKGTTVLSHTTSRELHSWGKVCEMPGGSHRLGIASIGPFVSRLEAGWWKRGRWRVARWSGDFPMYLGETSSIEGNRRAMGIGYMFWLFLSDISCLWCQTTWASMPP